MTSDEQPRLPVGGQGKEGPRSAIERARAAQRLSSRARRSEEVSDEEIRRAVAKAEATAIRRALEQARRAQQRRVFLTLGR
jgi:hypothetical protein